MNEEKLSKEQMCQELADGFRTQEENRKVVGKGAGVRNRKSNQMRDSILGNNRGCLENAEKEPGLKQTGDIKKMVQRFQKIGKVQVSKLQGRGGEEEGRRLHCRTQMRGPQKPQGLQTASLSEPRPASPNLVHSVSFPTRPSTHTSQPPDVRLSSFFLKRASFLTFPVFLPVY